MRHTVAPVVAVAAGDPCGIGPEVILKTLRDSPLRSRRAQQGSPAHRRARLVVIGSLAVFEWTAKTLQLRLPSWQVVEAGSARQGLSGELVFLNCPAPMGWRAGRPSRRAGAAALAYLDHAIALWREHRIQALVTAPVTKWAIARTTPSFRGQTEYLASAMGARDVVMMFIADELRVALLTRHVPLRQVSRAITPRALRMALRLTATALTRWFGLPHPRLAVCGLNPHAGEEGRCGREERAVMLPVLRSLRRDGLVCDGPFAADGLFACLRLPLAGRQAEGGARYDAIIAPYHDQGLIPFKMTARDRGCQLSVGLPIVRTSPDHGSALDIAGRGIAHPGSMRYALELAIRLASGVRPQAGKARSVRFGV